ncbi:hypothetical protein BCON_0010g00660 [Botryotinia convoluta]|uniref:Uncharacterized protein n=1 Tax=Botryotinia convoluta TaxID=54673 RepID=A0A4Z1IX47_9HELO|nr:hypothetical protein BCON_0010g00660 [Botryotinia convoluta]
MSHNYNGGDDLFWYNNQQVSLPIAVSTSNDVNEGIKATASTDTSSTNPTPTKFQAEWPYENSQHVEGSSQGWFSTSGLRQNTHASAVLPQMPRSPRQYSSNVNNFDTQSNGGLPNMTGLEIYSTPDEILYNPSLQNAFGRGNFSVSQQDTPIGELLDDCNMDASATGFGTPVPSRYQTHIISSVGSDAPADLQSPIQVENSPFGTSTQFASSTQNGEAPQQESTSQGEQYQAGFFNETMTAQLNRSLSAPPAGHWVLEQGLSYTATGLGMQLPLDSLPTATLQSVPLAYRDNWQYDGPSIDPAIGSDVPLAQQSNDIQNAPSCTLGDNLGQDAGMIQGGQLQQQQNDGPDQGTLPVARQQTDVSTTRSPIRSDGRRHSDPASVPVRDARESQQRVQVPSQLSEQAAQYQTPSMNASRARQLSGALIEDALGAMDSRRFSDTSPVPAQELHDTNPSPTGVRTESWQRSQNQATSQSGRVAQQPTECPVTVPEYHGSFPGVEPHATFAYPERSQQPAKQRKSTSFTSGRARLREIARPPLQLVASAPPAVTQQQPTRRDKQLRQPGRQSAQSGTPSTQQSQRVPRRGPPRVQISPQADSPQAQGTGSQPSIPQNRFDRILPSRLDPKTAAFANVEPAEDFMKTLSKMPFLDRVACFDRLMREDLFKDYMKPHIFREYNTGRENGLKLALERRTKGPLHGIIETTEINHERHSMKWKAKFDDMQIESECRRRELAARTAAGGKTTDTSEDLGMTPVGSKRRYQTPASAQDSHYEIDDDEVIESDDGSDDHLFVHPRNSPKKPRTSGPTSSGPRPSDITDKFCSHAVENIPFLSDPIHSQLCKLSIEQLIIPVQEYIAQNGEIADTNVEHWRACAGQAAGTEMEQEMICTHCADHMQDGSVPFASCVILGATIPAGNHFKGACMNCVYLGKDQDCSLQGVESEETEAQ